jgi:hypothetical protein
MLSAKDYVKHSYPQITTIAERIKNDILQNKICFKILEPIYRGKFENPMENYSLGLSGYMSP